MDNIPWVVLLVLGPVLLVAAIAYGVYRAPRRGTLGPDRNRLRDRQTEKLYAEPLEEAAAPPLYGEAPSPTMANKADGQRPTEDDVVTAMLGPRGVPREPDTSRMTPQREKKTPSGLDPGHTA